MTILGITQPQEIRINEHLKLKRYDGAFEFALPWYQDEETVRLVDGEKATLYDLEKLKRMYDYLDKHGELYFIEVEQEGVFIPIGDVTFWQHDMPIVIGEKSYQRRGIGRLVIEALIQRARKIGYKEIYVGEIYSFNEGSIAAFKKCGFQAYKTTENGSNYKLEL